jgi:hypothetical protein
MRKLPTAIKNEIGDTMGAQLLAFYEKAKAKGGLSAMVKLALITQMASSQASSAPDSPENIKLFSQAFAQI